MRLLPFRTQKRFLHPTSHRTASINASRQIRDTSPFLIIPGANTLEKIEKEIERLSPKDQLRLVEKLFNQLRKTGLAVKKELDWKNLYPNNAITKMQML